MRPIRVLWLVCVWCCGCGESRSSQLIAELSAPEVDARCAAAAELGALGAAAEPAVPALIGLVMDPDAQVRQAACRALGSIPPAQSRAAPALAAALDDAELSVRLAAAMALLRLDPAGERYVPVLNAAMRDGEGGTIVVVGQLGPRAQWALPTLTKLLRDRRPGIRRLAAEALGRIGPDADAVQALTKAQQDSDDRVRAAAQAALHGR